LERIIVQEKKNACPRRNRRRVPPRREGEAIKKKGGERPKSRKNGSKRGEVVFEKNGYGFRENGEG